MIPKLRGHCEGIIPTNDPGPEPSCSSGEYGRSEEQSHGLRQRDSQTVRFHHRSGKSKEFRWLLTSFSFCSPWKWHRHTSTPPYWSPMSAFLICGMRQLLEKPGSFRASLKAIFSAILSARANAVVPVRHFQLQQICPNGGHFIHQLPSLPGFNWFNWC